jgi:hypothetical protein
MVEAVEVVAAADMVAVEVAAVAEAVIETEIADIRRARRV